MNTEQAKKKIKNMYRDLKKLEKYVKKEEEEKEDTRDIYYLDVSSPLVMFWQAESESDEYFNKKKNDYLEQQSIITIRHQTYENRGWHRYQLNRI